MSFATSRLLDSPLTTHIGTRLMRAIALPNQTVVPDGALWPSNCCYRVIHRFSLIARSWTAIVGCAGNSMATVRSPYPYN